MTHRKVQKSCLCMGFRPQKNPRRKSPSGKTDLYPKFKKLDLKYGLLAEPNLVVRESNPGFCCKSRSRGVDLCLGTGALLAN